MKFNKIILISLLLLALVSFGAVSATDNLNSTDDLTVQTISDDVDLTIEDMEIINGGSDEILKEEASSIVVTNDTFTKYFDSEGKILDTVPEGATLDFQGQIIASDNINAIYINKPVNIMSSTKDATITLNSFNGTDGKENIANRFVVDGVSSITIKDVIFNRTQILIYDSNNVVLDNISLISDNYRIISSDKQLIIKTPFLKLNNINGFILKNSYFYANNIGSSIIGCDNAKDLLFDNNTFNCFSDNSKWDKAVWSAVIFPDFVDTNVTLINNKIFGSGVSILAKNILFENNTIASADLNGNNNSNIIVRNNILKGLTVSGKSFIYNNVINEPVRISSLSCRFSEGCVVYNNVLYKVDISGSDVIVKNSSFNSLSISAKARKNVTVENNDINGEITVNAGESLIENNTIKGNIKISTYTSTGVACEIRNNVIYGDIDVKSSLSIIQNNVIFSSSDYAIKITRDKRCLHNEVSYNKLYSKLYCGDNAVRHSEDYFNFVEFNTPVQEDLFVNTSVKTFDYGENTTILLNMPDVNGNVTIDVDGEKYIVEMVNGTASQVLTKYALGVNNVSIIYEDVLNDISGINLTTFTVNKVAYCPIGLSYGDAWECRSVDINVILPNDADGLITFTVSNGVYRVDIEQEAIGAENIITLNGLFEGNYTLSATFDSIKYVTNSTYGNISFVHIPVYDLTADNVVMDYNDGSKYNVLVTKDGKAVGEGEIVKITFNGKTSEIKTDKNGYATLTLDVAPKTYAIKSVYNGVTKSNTVTIKNVLKASNISKKKAKTIKFSATLKTSKGKAIIGKKITFKVKGKTYSAKTNKKGVATVSIKNLKVGKYTITSKYGACTVKNTIKIKK